MKYFITAVLSFLIALIVFLMITSLAHAASTETCPAVENGAWIWVLDAEPKSTNEYKWELVTSTESQDTICNADGHLMFLWRKVDWKIEWKCADQSSVTYTDAECHGEWLGYYDSVRERNSHGWAVMIYAPSCKDVSEQHCVREIGYREDGICIWRKRS